MTHPLSSRTTVQHGQSGSCVLGHAGMEFAQNLPLTTWGRESFKGIQVNVDQSARVHVDLCRAILDHLASYPHAADSAVGVARWWLGPNAAAVALPDVERVLRQLVERKELRQETLADGTTLYSKDLTATPKP